jgi:hypothetical protein
VRAQRIDAQELGSRGPVALVDGPALLAFARGVAGGHQDNPHARKVGLVLDEGAELEEVPVGVSCPLLSLNRDPLVDAPEVLDGKTASGALAFCTTCLAMMWLVLRW